MEGLNLYLCKLEYKSDTETTIKLGVPRLTYSDIKLVYAIDEIEAKVKIEEWFHSAHTLDYYVTKLAIETPIY